MPHRPLRSRHLGTLGELVLDSPPDRVAEQVRISELVARVVRGTALTLGPVGFDVANVAIAERLEAECPPEDLPAARALLAGYQPDALSQARPVPSALEQAAAERGYRLETTCNAMREEQLVELVQTRPGRRPRRLRLGVVPAHLLIQAVDEAAVSIDWQAVADAFEQGLDELPAGV